MHAPALVLALSLALAACSAGAVPEDAGAAASAGDAATNAPPALDPIHAVDLVLMIDNSLSTIGVQSLFRAQLPRLVGVLSRGDLDDDGVTDFPQVTSMHIGVVSSDLGVRAPYAVEGCEGSGDDAVFNDRPDPDMSELVGGLEQCALRYPRYLSFDAASDDPEPFAGAAACIAALGQEGCGVEQPLESTLKALWPADDDRVLFTPDESGGGTRGQGHGGGANQGFLRNRAGDDDTLLVIVMLTIEDDCSHPDPSFLRPPAFLDPDVPEDADLLARGLRTRCPTLTDRLHPIERYVDGLRALHEGREDLVMFTVIAGVPQESVEHVPVDFGDSRAARDAFYDGILDHPDMQVRVDTLGTEMPDDDSIASACEGNVALRADPARRLVEVARAFGENGMVQSVCEDDYGPAVDAILARVADRLDGGPR